MDTPDEVFAHFCLHNFIAVDVTPIQKEEATEDGLRDISAKNATLLLSKLFGLPSEMSDEGRLVIVPTRQTFPIPRFRKIPSEKLKTRWEKFAQEKNIHTRKRSRMVWDNEVKDWIPRWGSGSAKNLKQKAEEVVIEMKDGEDLKSIIESRRSESKLSKKKQEFRELRNKVETSGGKLPKYNPHIAAIAALGTDDRKKGKDALGEMNRRAAVSTASFGVHDKPINLSKKTSRKFIQKNNKKGRR